MPFVKSNGFSKTRIGCNDRSKSERADRIWQLPEPAGLSGQNVMRTEGALRFASP
jgi:hypothetical protein